MRNQKTKIMVEAALMVALAVILSRVQFRFWPQGGSITLASMTPIVLLSLRRGWRWGLLGSFALSLLQMLLDGVMAPPVANFFWYTVVVLLDYVLAYTVLGLAGIFAKPFGQKKYAPAVGAVAVTGLRYLCHIASGIAVWGVYAPDTMPVWLYAVVYNGSYMVPEMILTSVAAVLLVNALKGKVPN